MKKIVVIFCVAMMLMSMTACGQEKQSYDSNEKSTSNNANLNVTDNNIGNEESSSSNNDKDESFSAGVQDVNNIEELEKNINKDVEDTINSLNLEWKELADKITTYDDYTKQVELVKAFYDHINEVNEQLCVRLQEYTIKYAELILVSDMSNEDKYDAFDDLNDCIYDDAADDLNDGIYDGLLEEMNDVIYDEVLDDSDDAESYSEWYEYRSDEYEYWYDTRSDVYENWYDTRSDIYSFYYDMRGDLWGNEIEEAEETLADYKEDVEKLKK